MLKIALNTTSLNSSRTGIGNYTYFLGKYLRTLELVDLYCFYGANWSSQLREFPIAGANHVLPLIRNYLPFSYELKNLIQKIAFAKGARSIRPDVYHEPNFVIVTSNVPTVVTIHDLSWISFPQTHPIERVRFLNANIQRSLDFAAKIITPTNFVKNEVVNLLGVSEEKIFVTNLGVDYFLKPQPQEMCKGLESFGLRYKKYILVVGTIEPRKNLKTAIRAYCKLPQIIKKNYKLVAVGQAGWGGDGLELAESLRRSGDFIWLDYVAGCHMPALYSAAALTLYPSIYEGFGLPPIESMACGTPVVAGNSGAVNEVCGQAAHIVEALDCDAFAEEIRKLIDDPVLYEMSARKGLILASQYRWDRCARQTYEVYLGCHQSFS